jgi:hypothetical protein
VSIENRDELEALLQHKEFVESGLFDEIPQTEVKVNQAVTLKQNGRLYKVFEVDEELGMTIVGYDRGEEQVRLAMALEDVRDAKSYLKAALKFRGADKEFDITIEHREGVDGVVGRLWKKPPQN